MIHLQEYVGEMISKEEGERRGALYELKRHSFLFKLNDQYDIDATRMGNELRFVNSSDDEHPPNTYIKYLMVNGDHRIGLYALRDLQAGEELLFDYAYSEEEKKKYFGET